MLPSWVYYMVAACFAAFLVGWIIAWLVDEYGSDR
jgi:hypothetical protein